MNRRRVVFLLLIFFFPFGLSAGKKPKMDYRTVGRSDGGVDIYFSPAFGLCRLEENLLAEKLKKAAGTLVIISRIDDETKVSVLGSSASLDKILVIVEKRLKVCLQKAGSAAARGHPRAFFVQKKTATTSATVKRMASPK